MSFSLLSTLLHFKKNGCVKPAQWNVLSWSGLSPCYNTGEAGAKHWVLPSPACCPGSKIQVVLGLSRSHFLLPTPLAPCVTPQVEKCWRVTAPWLTRPKLTCSLTPVRSLTESRSTVTPFSDTNYVGRQCGSAHGFLLFIFHSLLLESWSKRVIGLVTLGSMQDTTLMFWEISLI